MEIVGSEPPSATQIAERFGRLTARLRQIAADHGHDPERLRIVAVTKSHGLEVVRRAVDAGLTRLGESRVQEAEPKIAAIPDAEWHLVGRLQSNKARRAVRAFAAIHSVDSVALLRRIGAIAREEGRSPMLLLQINVSGDAAKAGMAPDEALTPDLLSALGDVPAAGLMTIAPMGASDEEARAVFAALRGLRNRLEQTTGHEMPELSMGMSADAEAAVAVGATLVRIGTAIFGPRV